jgi:hypothetical protein
MSVRRAQFILVALAVVLTGCSWKRSEGRSSRDDRGVRSEGGAIIIERTALDERRGSVLGAMEGRVPGMTVQRHSGRCPQVSLRSHVTFQSLVNPHVYVNGTRATDTCILETMRTDDVASVEVYPMGFTKRPGYGTHAHGLILLFLRSARGL